MNQIETQLQKLREMYRKYPDRRDSIMLQVKVLNLSKNAKPPKRVFTKTVETMSNKDAESALF